MGPGAIRWRSRASPASSVPKLELGNEKIILKAGCATLSRPTGYETNKYSWHGHDLLEVISGGKIS
jgi:hypothetical protein